MKSLFAFQFRAPNVLQAPHCCLNSLFKKKPTEENNRFFRFRLEFMKIAIYKSGEREGKMYTVTLSPAPNQRDEQYVLLSQNNFLFVSLFKSSPALLFAFLLNGSDGSNEFGGIRTAIMLIWRAFGVDKNKSAVAFMKMKMPLRTKLFTQLHLERAYRKFFGCSDLGVSLSIVYLLRKLNDNLGKMVGEVSFT